MSDKNAWKEELRHLIENPTDIMSHGCYQSMIIAGTSLCDSLMAGTHIETVFAHGKKNDLTIKETLVCMEFADRFKSRQFAPTGSFGELVHLSHYDLTRTAHLGESERIHILTNVMNVSPVAFMLAVVRYSMQNEEAKKDGSQ